MSWLAQLLSNHLTEVLALSVAFLGAIWLWIQYYFNYWERHNVPYVKANPFFGNMNEVFLGTRDICTHFDKLYYHEASKDHPVIGFHSMQQPCLLVRNLDLIKNILIKDFNKFSNRFSTSDPHSDSLGSDNLFFSRNPRWKEIRVKLSPVFSSGKIKQMFPLVAEIGLELDKYLLKLTESSKEKSNVQEVKDICGLFTTDVIATVAFGVTANSLENPESDFRRNGKRVFHFTRKRALEFFAFFFWPSSVSLFRFKVFSRESEKFIKKTLRYVLGERIKSGDKRNDLIDVLVKFKKEAEAEKDKHHFILQKDCLIAQAAIFFTAGFETSSATMSFALYELSKKPKIQQRLREEIKEALISCDGNLTYDIIMEMKYLDSVLREVLRLYPPLPFLDRSCTFEPNEKGYSLKPFLDYDVPHNMAFYIPICSLHRDPRYFSNPNEFDPDRFTPESKSQDNMNAYMPFGIGPHSCIGERFALVQTKVGLCNIFKNHYVTPCQLSHKEMILEPKALIIQSKGGIYCNIIRDPLIV